jgi:two-component system, OmpR family, sensor histidine kinase TorS
VSIDPHNLDCTAPQGPSLEEGGATWGPGLPRLIVLVVEDDPDTAHLLERFVRSWGHSPVLASTCEAARAAVAVVKFNVALCDIQLPDGDGVDLVEEMRRYQPLPCLAVTAHALASDVERYRRGGIDEVLPKPFDAEALKAALTRLSHAHVPLTQ